MATTASEINVSDLSSRYMSSKNDFCDLLFVNFIRKPYLYIIDIKLTIIRKVHVYICLNGLLRVYTTDTTRISHLMDLFLFLFFFFLSLILSTLNTSVILSNCKKTYL